MPSRQPKHLIALFSIQQKKLQLPQHLNVLLMPLTKAHLETDRTHEAGVEKDGFRGA